MTRACDPEIFCVGSERETPTKEGSLTRGSEDLRVYLQSEFLSPPTYALPEVRIRPGQFYLFWIYSGGPRPG